MLHSTPDQLRFPPIAGYTIRADFEGGAVATHVKQYKDQIRLHLPTSCPVKALLHRVTTFLSAIPVPALNTS